MSNNILINRNFTLIWIGQLISQIGDKFYAIALAWWILQKSNSPSIMGLFMAASVLPGLLLGPVAGGLIDRGNRKTIMVAADFLRGALVLAAALLSCRGSLQIWHIFGVGVIISMATAFFNPTVATVLPRIVPPDNLTRANALSQLVSGFTTVLGPIAGAGVMAFAGLGAVFLTNGVSFFVSGGLIMLLDRNLRPLRRAEAGLAADIGAGLHFVIKSRKVLIILMVICLAHLYVGSLAVAMPFLARQLAGKGVRNLGLLETAIGAGMMLSALALNRKKRQHIGDAWLFTAMMLMGVSLIVASLIIALGVDAVAPFMGLTALVGLAVAVASVYWQSLLQANVPNAMAGRVFSIAGTLGNATLPMAYMVFGILLGSFSLSAILGFCGAGLVTVCYILGRIFGKASWAAPSLLPTDPDPYGEHGHHPSV